jgi:hypothetical protein
MNIDDYRIYVLVQCNRKMNFTKVLFHHHSDCQQALLQAGMLKSFRLFSYSVIEYLPCRAGRVVQYTGILLCGKM